MMSILLVLSAPGLAADPSTYGRVGAVTLPAEGPVRVTLPPDLVGGRVDTLSQGLLLTDATGRAVPYAVLRSSTSGPTETTELDYRPLDGASWLVEAGEAPVDALALDVSDLEGEGPFLARVSWAEGGAAGSAEAMIYRVGDTESRTVDVPHVEGPFRVTLTGYGLGRPRLEDVTAVRNAPDHVPPNVETVEVPTPVVTESGSARYTLHLGGMRTVRGVRFTLPSEVDVLDREVIVRAPGAEMYSGSYTTGRIRRLVLGRANVDRTEVSVEGIVADTLVVEIPLERGAPLPISRIDIVSEGAWLVTRDAGPAPHALYGAATALDDAYDLAVALPELLRGTAPVVALGAITPNPGFVPTPTREEVDLPGPDLNLSRFGYERAIEGAGWVRLRLGRDVLARTQADLEDVRVVDAEGRQLPFLLFDAEEEEPWPVADVERTEEGGATLLRVPLDGTSPVGSLRLETSRGVFERTVTVLRDAGRYTVPIRSVVWNGPDRGGTLAIDIGERVGDTLLVRIDNGDDAPIPIDSVQVGSPVWELRVRVPEGGARLVYGAPGARAPTYDLALLQEEVRTMPVTDATLGEERSLTPPAASAVDKVATLAGVAMLVVGLLGMVVRVLRGVPARAEG